MKIDVTGISSVIRLDSGMSWNHFADLAKKQSVQHNAEQIEQFVFVSAGHRWVLSALADSQDGSETYLYCDNGDCYDSSNSNSVEIFGYLHLLQLAKSVLDHVSVSEHDHRKDDEHVMRTLERCV